MTKSGYTDLDEVLDQDTLELLGSAAAGADVPAKRMAQLRSRVMHRVDEETAISNPYVTIGAGDGQWIEIGPQIEKKVLNLNNETGIESYLLRLHPGANPDGHRHEEDELCIVLEGDVSFDDIHLQAGDFHFARKGSWHGRATTVNGALLFLQSGVTAAQVTA